MQIIPALYLSGGNAVSHYKGEVDQSTILSRDPLRSAREFEKQGARMIHLVDLDATDGGSDANQKITKIIAKNTHLQVQYAEGIISIENIASLFSAGVARVSLNQFSENLVQEALKQFGPEKIIFTIRAQRNIIDGRPGLEVFHYGKDLADQGIAQIIFRDTKVEGSFHPNFDEVERLILGCPAEIYAFGGIGNMDDLEILQRTGAAGAIISRAFFEDRLSLQQCIRFYTLH
ncbi:hypothetical protein HYW83_03765 [Candidatus Peregrinibacteria bacterium]|nr:hypothetical protein [Candidatus Peregrinibacteria bacterium]